MWLTGQQYNNTVGRLSNLGADNLDKKTREHKSSRLKP
jgi:hypothetical protein